jgi:hypothetical protein
MRMAVFWFVAPYSPLEIYRRFKGTYCLHHQGDNDATSAEDSYFHCEQFYKYK